MINVSRKLLGLSLALSLAAAAGCSASAADDSEGAQAQEGELRPLERKAIGKAADYPADVKNCLPLNTCGHFVVIPQVTGFPEVYA